MSEIREWLGKIHKESYNYLPDDACRIALLHHYEDDTARWIRVYPCGVTTERDHRVLHGNGTKFAYREALRTAKRLHMTTCETKESAQFYYFSVRITTNKDVKRLEELWKYLTGKQFNKRILNNGWWE